MAGNAVWALFFTMGFIPNAVYTIYLMNKNKSFGRFIQPVFKNYLLGFEMAVMWIGKLLLLWSRRCKNWRLGLNHRLAALHINFHRYRKSLGHPKRGMEGCSGYSPKKTQPGIDYNIYSNDPVGLLQYFLKS